MVEIKVDNQKCETHAEGKIIDLTCELMCGVVSVMKEMVEDQPHIIKEYQVNMFCDVLKETLEKTNFKIDETPVWRRSLLGLSYQH